MDIGVWKACLVGWIQNSYTRNSWSHGETAPVLAERIRSVHHDGVIVKPCVDSDFIWSQKFEVVDESRIDVVPVDVQELVSIMALVQVVESNNVHQFVENNSIVFTSSSERKRLSPSSPSNARVTAAASNDVNKVLFMISFLEFDTRSGLNLSHCIKYEWLDPSCQVPCDEKLYKDKASERDRKENEGKESEREENERKGQNVSEINDWWTEGRMWLTCIEV